MKILALHILLLTSSLVAAADTPSPTSSFSSTPPQTWLDGTGLAVSVVFAFEGGGQPTFGAIPPAEEMEDMAQYLSKHKKPDYPTRTWYEYAVHEGIPRILRLLDTFSIKASCLVSTAAAQQSPALAKEITQRGHEAVCHSTQYMTQFGSVAEERQFLADTLNLTERYTGQRCQGFNALWMEHSDHTNDLLHDLGLLYHVDDLSRDIPFTKRVVSGGQLAVVPYTVRNHDILLRSRGLSASDLLCELMYEFEELYAESRHTRRMMTLTIHDFVGSVPGHVHVYRTFLAHATRMPGVWFARKDWLAQWAMQQGPHYSCASTSFICPANTCYAGCPPPGWDF